MISMYGAVPVSTGMFDNCCASRGWLHLVKPDHFSKAKADAKVLMFPNAQRDLAMAA